jgi:type IV secretory pathway TrbF-like protein
MTLPEYKPSWVDRFGDYRPTIKDWVIVILAGILLHGYLKTGCGLRWW